MTIATTRDRGRIAMGQVMRRSDMLNADDFAELLNTRPSAVARLRRLGLVLGLHTKANDGYRYPAWQVDGAGKVHAAIPALLKHLPSPWAVYRVLTQTHPKLRCTGIDAVRRGRGDDVLALLSRGV